MAKKVTTVIKLQLPAGGATPAPPVGPALGQHGVNIGQMAVGRAGDQPGGDSVGVLNLDAEPSPVALDDIRQLESISSAIVIHLPPAGELPAWLQS